MNDVVDVMSKFSLVHDADAVIQQNAAEIILGSNVEYDVALLQGFEIVALSVTVLVASHVLMLEQRDVLTMRLSKGELAVAVCSLVRISIVAILMGLTSAGDADVGFLIADDTYVVAYIMYIHIAFFVATCVLGTWLITHANADNVAGKRRSSRLQKKASSSSSSGNDLGHAPLGSAALSAMMV